MPDLPPQMVEAAAEALFVRDGGSLHFWSDRERMGEEVRAPFVADATAALAAALSVCEVREERRARWSDYERVVPDYVTTWTVGHLGSLAPGAAIDYRLVITTPAEEANHDA